MAVLIPQQAFEAALRTSGLAPFNWAVQPYYQQPPEPLPNNSPSAGPFPYVTYTIPLTNPNHTMGRQQGQVYSEWWDFEVSVVSVEKDIVALTAPGGYGDPAVSVYAFLDSFKRQPERLSGGSFVCGGFYRKNYQLGFDAAGRSPAFGNQPEQGGQRVWIGKADYRFLASVSYP